MAQKPVLGKGLASLLPPGHKPLPPGGMPGNLEGPGSTPMGGNLATTSPTATPAPTTASMASGAGAVAAGPPIFVPPDASGQRDRHLGISMVSIEEIQTNHYQPRREFDEGSLQELATSIRSSGIIQPLVVRKKGTDGFELIAGERRLRAARIAGLKQVPIVIRRSTDRESLELALIENIQRQDLNCVDEARAYFQLMQEFALTQEEISERVGKDRATVANYLRLLRLPESILDDLKKQALTFGHAKALLSLEDAETRVRVRNQILEKKLSVRETEALVDALRKQKKAAGDGNPSEDIETALSARLNQLSQDLTRQWSTKIEVKGSEHRGKIVFHYSTREDLDRILEGIQR